MGCQAKRESTATAAIIDPQSAKTSFVAGEVGEDGAGLIKADKGHIRVDTLKVLLQVVVSLANLSEKAGASLI